MYNFIKTYINSLIAEISAITTIEHYSTDKIGIIKTYRTDYNIKIADVTVFNSRFKQALNLMHMAINDKNSSLSITTDTSSTDFCYCIEFNYSKNCTIYSICICVSYEFNNEDDK